MVNLESVTNLFHATFETGVCARLWVENIIMWEWNLLKHIIQYLAAEATREKSQGQQIMLTLLSAYARLCLQYNRCSEYT